MILQYKNHDNEFLSNCGMWILVFVLYVNCLCWGAYLTGELHR